MDLDSGHGKPNCTHCRGPRTSSPEPTILMMMHFHQPNAHDACFRSRKGTTMHNDDDSINPIEAHPFLIGETSLACGFPIRLPQPPGGAGAAAGLWRPGLQEGGSAAAHADLQGHVAPGKDRRRDGESAVPPVFWHGWPDGRLKGNVRCQSCCKGIVNS